MQIKRLTSALNAYCFQWCLSAACLLCALPLNAQPQKLLEQADSLTRLKQYEAANDKLSAFIKAYPQRKYDLGEAYCNSARNCFYLKKLEQAATYNQTSTDIRSRIAPDALGWNKKLLARIKLARGAYAEALEYATEAADYPYFDDPLVPAEIALLQSEIHQQMGAYNKALAAADAAREIAYIIEGPEAPILAGIHLQRARLLSIQEQWAAAADASRSAIAVDDTPEARLMLGQSMLSMEAPRQAFLAAQHGVQLLKEKDVRLQQQLFEQGFLALFRLRQSDYPKDTLQTDTWAWAQHYLQQQEIMGEAADCKGSTADLPSFCSALPKKTAAVFFLEGTPMNFALYVTRDELQLQRLGANYPEALQEKPESGIPSGAFSDLFGPLEPLHNNIKQLQLIAPSDWPEPTILSIPVPASLITGSWPFRQKRQLLKERYEVLHYCSFTSRANPENLGKGTLLPH